MPMVTSAVLLVSWGMMFTYLFFLGYLRWADLQAENVATKSPTKKRRSAANRDAVRLVVRFVFRVKANHYG